MKQELKINFIIKYWCRKYYLCILAFLHLVLVNSVLHSWNINALFLKLISVLNLSYFMMLRIQILPTDLYYYCHLRCSNFLKTIFRRKNNLCYPLQFSLCERFESVHVLSLQNILQTLLCVLCICHNGKSCKPWNM